MPTRAGPLIALAAAPVLAGVLLACGAIGGDGDESATTEPIEPRSGGMTTSFNDTSEAFAKTARNINSRERVVFAQGTEVFNAYWTADPNDEFGGLGPNFDMVACAPCHVNDGRGTGPATDGPLPDGMITKLATDDPSMFERFGKQITRQHTEGTPEAQVSVVYEEVPGEFADGETYSLRRPTYVVEPGDGGPLDGDAVLGVRQAPQLSGMGLLELLPEADLEELADPEDEDGDGISGRLSEGTDLLTDTKMLGRFGWNASVPTIEQQAATALAGDMSLTSRYFPGDECLDGGECERHGSPTTSRWTVSDQGSRGPEESDEDSDWEVTDEQLFELTIYTMGLGVPAIRDVEDPEVLRGRDLFEDAGCTSCHAGGFTTGKGYMQGLSNQPVNPFTDLLLHDMGEELGDMTVSGDTVPTEWRTPPLWGIGLVETVNGHTTFLHDGRARNLEEAVLWHGGEAEATRDAYRTMDADDRAAVIRYLESL